MATNAQLKEKYEGKVYPTNNFGDLKIVTYNSTDNVEVEFINSGYKRSAALQSILVGSVKDKSVPTECGVGIVDIEGAVVNNKATPAYRLWNNMLQRCYNENMRDLRPTYGNCTVSEDFKYYSKFKSWYEGQVGFDKQGWHLDKDILVKGNKVYSEDTCCLVPAEINTLILNNKTHRGSLPVGVYYEKDTGKLKVRVSINGKQKHIGRFTCKQEAFQAYQKAKKEQMMLVADKWKDQIDPRVYQALINWQVEITD